MFAAHCVAIWTHRRRDVPQDVSQDVSRDVLPGFAGRSAGRFTRFAYSDAAYRVMWLVHIGGCLLPIALPFGRIGGATYRRTFCRTFHRTFCGTFCRVLQDAPLDVSHVSLDLMRLTM